MKVSDCCKPSGYERIFSDRLAARDLDSYRKDGLDRIAGRMVGFLVDQDVSGARVLEVGGGIGAIQVDLLRSGADHTVNYELSSGYEETAATFLEEEELTERVERRVADFAEDHADLDPADHVVMNRVVCCYPDMAKLVDAALQKTRRWAAISFPRDRWFIRIGLRALNLFNRMFANDFRAYVHDPDEIVAVAADVGFRVAFDTQDRIWRGIVFERAA